jgi:hypothetical protein
LLALGAHHILHIGRIRVNNIPQCKPIHLECKPIYLERDLFLSFLMINISYAIFMEHNDLHSAPNIVPVIKPRMRWGGGGACSTYERSTQGFRGET